MRMSAVSGAELRGATRSCMAGWRETLYLSRIEPGGGEAPRGEARLWRGPGRKSEYTRRINRIANKT